MVARSENLDRTVENTVRNSEKLERTVEDTAAANCMMLLSRVGGGGGGESRVYRCKTCMKEFPSFQSLGGHRASHNKHVNNSSSSSDEQSSSSLSSGSVAKKKAKNAREHRCLICGLEFPMGQALGGHMRKHRNEEEASGALVTRSFFPVTSTTTLNKSSYGKVVACLDLGSDSMESGINLNLELGSIMY